MPIGFHRHHEGDGKGSANPSTANRYTYGGNPVGHSTANRPVGGSATTATGQSSAGRTSGVSADQLQRFDVLLRRPENRECFDCAAKQPRWASTNLGIFFCLRCAGIHRSMGTHISKVKSTNMDAWEESMIQVMEHIGNARARLLYEFNMPASAKVTSSTETPLVERALRAKYEKKTYYNPQFAELYAEFMATPIEGVSGDGKQSGNAQAAAPPQAQINAPPRRVAPAQPAQPAAKAPIDELWGAPVSSPVADQPNANQHKNHNVTSVAELFSGSYPAGVGADPRMNTAWNASPLPAMQNNNNHNSPGGNGSASPYASPSSATNSDWFDSNFGGSTGNPRGSGAPSPATPHSPYTAGAATSRSNTDDLFQGSGGTPTSGGNNTNAAKNGGGTKSEILSLFASAPVAGAGGQSSSHHSSPNSGHPMAWQPQTVKPYYYPE